MRSWRWYWKVILALGLATLAVVFLLWAGGPDSHTERPRPDSPPPDVVKAADARLSAAVHALSLYSADQPDFVKVLKLYEDYQGVAGRPRLPHDEMRRSMVELLVGKTCTTCCAIYVSRHEQALIAKRAHMPELFWDEAARAEMQKGLMRDWCNKLCLGGTFEQIASATAQTHPGVGEAERLQEGK
jgi:hypothetical protein